ncbi:site-specific integrase [Sphaerisporangium aureirubrum]|uniref:Site-specific integrase n=1 Tax=Sphaerisporangium aureirubrum TaxID=1544736 RepID=A0ABW1NMG1_9ACTN
MTGMRRGELLALRWRDVDLEVGTVAIRRSVGVVRVKGEGARVVEGPTKTTKPRVVDLDEATVALMRAHKRERGGLALTLAHDDALVFGDVEGRHRHPERFSRSFKEHLTRCRTRLEAIGVELPDVRLHDLRHTHATILLSNRVPVKVVSERLGHASPTITLTVYAHVMPGQSARRRRPVRLSGGQGVEQDPRCEVSRQYRAVRRIQRTTIAGVMLLAMIAAVVSYRHMHQLCLRHGEGRQPWPCRDQCSHRGRGVSVQVVPHHHKRPAELLVSGVEQRRVVSLCEALAFGLATAVRPHPVDQPCPVAGPGGDQPGERHPPVSLDRQRHDRGAPLAAPGAALG